MLVTEAPLLQNPYPYTWQYNAYIFWAYYRYIIIQKVTGDLKKLTIPHYSKQIYVG
jgi:hypothetical protein